MQSRPYYFLSLAILLTLLPARTCVGQRPGSSSAPGTSGGIIVTVRNVNGSGFSYFANVSLYKQGRGLITSSGRRMGDKVYFDGVAPGYYTVEVKAPGYKTASVPAYVTIQGQSCFVDATMEPENGTDSSGNASGPPILTPKALKETQEGLDALQQKKFEQARIHLERALRMAPGSADVNYLCGVLYLEMGDLSRSAQHLGKATSIDPKHAPALFALGETYYRQKAYPLAIETLQKGLGTKPNYWRAQWLIASSYLEQGDYGSARDHLKAALEIGKEEASQARLPLAKCLVALGERDQAIVELEAFLAKQPSGPEADSARQLLQQLRSPASPKRQPAAPPNTAILPMSLTPSLHPSFLRWAPPDVDEAKPEASDAATCPLPELLKQAGTRVKQFVSDIESFAATENLEHEQLNPVGIPHDRETRTFTYVATINRTSPGVFFIEEYRDGSAARELFPAAIATLGLPALALAFHPDRQEEFEYSCEGLGDWSSTAAWLVHFRQRANQPRGIQFRSYRVNQQSFPVALKGRAWIATNSFQILRMEADLIEPIPQIRLFRDHQAVEYAPVHFQKQKAELWLPQFAELHFDLGGKRYRRKHSFTNFLLFSVDEKQRITPPKEVASGTPEGQGKN